MNTEIFKRCSELANIFGEAVKKRSAVMETLDKEVESTKKLFLHRLRNDLLTRFTVREWKFLNLKTTENEALLSLIIKNLLAIESTVPGSYEFKFQYIRVEITDSEINDNGFYFDSGRDEIKAIIDSFSEKFGLLYHSAFYLNDKPTLTIWFEDKTSEG